MSSSVIVDYREYAKILFVSALSVTAASTGSATGSGKSGYLLRLGSVTGLGKKQ